MSCKHEDHIIILDGGALIILALVRWRQEDPWGSLANQSSLIDELQDSEKPCLKRRKWMAFLRVIPRVSSGLHVEPYAPAHTETCTCTHALRKS